MPAPGGPRELAELAAHLNAIPLDRSRPLWEMWLIDGVAGGHVAVLSKVHHAAIDGASGNEITVATLDLSPGGLRGPAARGGVDARHHPLRRRDAGPRHGLAAARRRSGWSRPPDARSTPPSAGGACPASSSPPAPFAAPRTSINGPLTRQRVFATTSLSLPAVKAIKAHHDVKVNDVVLALCAGALRR